MKSTDIAERVRAVTGFTVNEISEQDLSVLINTALDEYLYYRPGLQITAVADALTTVKDQAYYDAPSDALWVVEVFWNPGLADEDEDLYIDEVIEAVDPLHPSELTAFYQRLGAFRKYFAGHWRKYNGQIWLSPVPTETGDHVAVCYAKAKTLDDLNAIQDVHFFNMVRGMAEMRVGTDSQKTGDWRSLSYSVSKGTSGKQLFDAGEKRYNSAKLCAANAFVAERSGEPRAVRSED